ncbi:MAG TPA: YdcF family protein [Azospirillaceae bacterium]|nr:YdcF family protein [Azospirillaceae bacterium]
MSFLLSKLLWGLAAPGNLLLLLLVIGLGLLAWGKRRAGWALSGGAAALLVVAAVLPVGGWLARPLEQRFAAPDPLPERVDGIIVLGGGVDPLASAESGRPELNAAAERMLALPWLGRRYPEAKLVFSGGSGRVLDPDLSEARVADLTWQWVGMPTDRVIAEDRSRNTWENAVLTREMVRPAEGEVWLLVTSAMHMPRAIGCFRAAGWPPMLPYPVDLRTTRAELGRVGVDLGGGLERLNEAAREWAGLIAYRLMGRTDSLFPAP